MASLGLGTMTSSCASSPSVNRNGKRILILGGTGFLGPALVEAAIQRGHVVTLFNSGTTEARRKDAGRPSVIPSDVEVLIGNRDPLLTADDRRRASDPEFVPDPDSPLGLTSLMGRSWDAVIDTSGFFPRMVEASASLLASNVDQYVFISTLSVVARNDVPDLDETAEVATMEDPTVEEFGARFENYGPGKALCEQAAEAAMPGRTTNIRPGYIVGPRDTSARYAYWPWRVAQGGEMLVPGSPDDWIQIIDVRDLAEWTLRCIEEKRVGIYNATGPHPPMNMGEMLAGCAEGVSATPELVYADASFLGGKGLRYPIWAASEGATAGFHRTSIQKAVDAGLTFRPQAETARATFEWIDGLPQELRERVVPVWLTENEKDVLTSWKQRSG